MGIGLITTLFPRKVTVTQALQNFTRDILSLKNEVKMTEPKSDNGYAGLILVTFSK